MPRLRALVAVVAAGLAVSACATGERPYFSDSPNSPGELTGDAAVDDVLALLDRAGGARFAADYTIITRFGGAEVDAQVAQLSEERRTVTIGDVLFRFDGTSVETCQLETGKCSPDIRDNLVSDVQVTHRFYAEEAAIRLRRDATDRIGDTAGEQTRVAGRPVTCVSIPLSGGTTRYCALDSGVLALDDDADVHIELTAYRGDVAGTDLASD